MHDEGVDVRAWLVLIFLSIIWGSSFILMKKALVALDPIDLACMRIVITATSFFPFLFIYRSEIPWDRWKQFFLVGITGNGLPAFLFFMAQTKISSSLSGLLNSLTPLWTMIIGALFFSVVLSKTRILGVIIGFLGAAVLILFGNAGNLDGDIGYSLLVVLATLSYGSSVNIVKTYFQHTRSVLISATSFCSIAPLPLLYILYNRSWDIDFTSTEVVYSFGAVLILSLVGTAFATLVFYKLVQNTSAIFGSSVAYLMPIVALGWGFLDGEAIYLTHSIGIVLILLGVYLIRRNK